MKLCLTTIIIFLLFTSLASAQIAKCGFDTLTFEINKFPLKDTLYDLILTRNAYKSVRGLDNIVFISKPLNSINFWVKNAELCYYKNDTTLIITPDAPSWTFSYTTSNNVYSKEFKSIPKSKQELVIQLDNKAQLENKDLINYAYIDSLSFDLSSEGIEKYYPEEDFKFVISKVSIFLIREKRPVDSKEFVGTMKTFYIGDLLRKGKPGDRLLIEYYPQWINRNQELSYMNCGGMINYTLGRRK